MHEPVCGGSEGMNVDERMKRAGLSDFKTWRDFPPMNVSMVEEASALKASPLTKPIALVSYQAHLRRQDTRMPEQLSGGQ